MKIANIFIFDGSLEGLILVFLKITKSNHLQNKDFEIQS